MLLAIVIAMLKRLLKIIRNMKNRLTAINQKYPDVSVWIKELFQQWLIFDS